MNRTAVVLALAVTLLCGAAAPAVAATYRVSPTDGPTALGDAVAQLADGDKLVLLPGDYSERLVLSGLARVKVIAKRGARMAPTGPGAAVQVALCDDLQLRGITIESSSAHGIFITGSARVRIKKATIRNTALHGIFVSSCPDMLVTRCSFTNTEIGLGLSSSERSVVTRSRFEGTSIRALTLGVDAALRGSEGFTFSRNVVEGTSDVAVLVGGGSGPDVVVARNRLLRCAGGVAAISSRTVVDRNVVEDSTADAILVDSIEGTATRNTVRRCAGTGILASARARAAAIARNRVEDCEPVGIDVLANECVVERNDVRNVTGDGISVGGTSGSFRMNKVTSASQSAFVVGSGGNTIEANVASGSGASDLRSAVAESENAYAKNRFATRVFE